jgi:SEC-C motif-containing protein
MTPCPCGSKKALDACCGALIAGAPAPTAEALMRSRYTAYATGNVDYLQRTSGGEALVAFDAGSVKRSMPETEWLGLEILATEAGGPDDDAGTVTFRARFRENGRARVLEERSQFRRLGGAWRYVRGEAVFTPAGAPSKPLGRNDPCPCGSGRKFKKCHGA